MGSPKLKLLKQNPHDPDTSVKFLEKAIDLVLQTESPSLDRVFKVFFFFYDLLDLTAIRCIKDLKPNPKMYIHSDPKSFSYEEAHKWINAETPSVMMDWILAAEGNLLGFLEDSAKHWPVGMIMHVGRVIGAEAIERRDGFRPKLQVKAILTGQLFLDSWARGFNKYCRNQPFPKVEITYDEKTSTMNFEPEMDIPPLQLITLELIRHCFYTENRLLCNATRQDFKAYRLLMQVVCLRRRMWTVRLEIALMKNNHRIPRPNWEDEVDDVNLVDEAYDLLKINEKNILDAHNLWADRITAFYQREAHIMAGSRWEFLNWERENNNERFEPVLQTMANAESVARESLKNEEKKSVEKGIQK